MDVRMHKAEIGTQNSYMYSSTSNAKTIRTQTHTCSLQHCTKYEVRNTLLALRSWYIVRSTRYHLIPRGCGILGDIHTLSRTADSSFIKISSGFPRHTAVVRRILRYCNQDTYDMILACVHCCTIIVSYHSYSPMTNFIKSHHHTKLKPVPCGVTFPRRLYCRGLS